MARKKASFRFAVLPLWQPGTASLIGGNQKALTPQARVELSRMDKQGWELVSVAPDPEDPATHALFTWRTFGVGTYTVLLLGLLLGLARPAVAQLPDAPVPQPGYGHRHRVADRGYWLMRAEHATALTLDIGSSISGQRNGCFEDSPIFGTAHPKPWMFAAYGAGEWTAVAAFDYWLKRHMERRGSHSRFWQVPTHFFSAAHVFAFAAVNQQNGCGF